jgi:hypothetical protein
MTISLLLRVDVKTQLQAVKKDHLILLIENESVLPPSVVTPRYIILVVQSN